MTTRTSFSGSPSSPQGGVSRRQLIAVGGAASVAALAGIGVAAIWGDSSNHGQVGYGSGAGSPAPAGRQLIAPQSIPASTPEATPAQAPAVRDEPVDPGEILQMASIRELRSWLDAGAFTVTQLVEASLARIQDIDVEVGMNAVISVNPDALAIAAELDADLAAGTIRGLLHGVPVLLKDIVATGDRMANTAGSLAMQDNVANRDAFLVTQLRNAGAVILGKTNLTEWSNYMGSTGLSGWSSLGGLTVNPHNLEMSASGSSSGSAAAVAAGYVPLAIGAEFDGSIIAPAAASGVVGLKPTVGLTSRSGVIPIGFTRDSIGPMTKTVEDAAIALSVMAALDPEDPGRTLGAEFAPWAMFEQEMVPAPGTADYTTALDPDALAGARFGVFVSHADMGEGEQRLFDKAIAILEGAGAEVVPGVSISTDGVSSTYVNSLTEFSWGLQNYLDTYTPDGPMRTIQDIVDFNIAHQDETLAITDQSGLTDALTALPIDDPAYLEVTETNTSNIRAEIARVMDELELDAFVAPTATLAGAAWDHTGFVSSSTVSSLAGYPSITIPIGTVDALPGGIHFFGSAFSEARLIGYAYALEQLLPSRPIPEYLNGNG